MIVRIAAVFFLSTLIVVPSALAAAQYDKLLSLTPSAVEAAVGTVDDGLETTAVLDTQAAFNPRRGFGGSSRDDNFVRAFVNKSSGETRFQVYQIISYSRDWRLYGSVNYETPEGPKSVEVTVIDRDVDSCGRYGCSFTEHLGFSVDEALLRRIAASYQPGQRVAWQFKFKAKSGDDLTTGMMPAEVAGLLLAVDEYKRSLKPSR